jgi:hypothetical protein
MRTAAILIANALLIAGLATTAVRAYPTTADRTAYTPRVKDTVETPQAPRPTTRIRVILPAPWESSVQATR